MALQRLWKTKLCDIKAGAAWVCIAHIARHTGAKFTDQIGAERDGIAKHGCSRVALDHAFLTVHTFAGKGGVDARGRSWIILPAGSEEEVVLTGAVVNPEKQLPGFIVACQILDKVLRLSRS